MDEILVANFMVFHDVARDGQYDLWIGDEAWDVDHFLHENPELKTAAFAWLTDFVGFLPMPDGGEREASLCADYNAEMIEHVERFPRVRDRAVFVGDPDDIVPDRFGADMPVIREWTREALRLLRVHLRLRPGRARGSGCAAARARVQAGRAGLHRDGRRLGRRRGATEACDRVLRTRQAASPGAADDDRRRSSYRSRPRYRSTTGSRSAPTYPTCTATWRRAIWRSSREALRRRWS